MNREKHEKILYKDECYQMQGAIFDVYREMGCGFLESVYQECLEKELSQRQFPFESQKGLKLFYKGKLLSLRYVPDVICYGKIIVKLEAVPQIVPEHKVQLLHHLTVISMKFGLLVNFGAYLKVQITRMGNTNFRVFRVFRG
jgi:GxxExxY protein